MNDSKPFTEDHGEGRDAQPKVLVLVLAHDADPWKTIESEGQRATWASCSHPSVLVRFYYGRRKAWQGSLVRYGTAILRRVRLTRVRSRLLRRVAIRSRGKQVREDGDRLFVPIPEAYVTITGKSFLALEYALDHFNFDFLLRTNTSSYVNLQVLLESVKDLPVARVYAGVVSTTRSGEAFISGAGILMSRDVVEAVVSDESFEFDQLDDVAIARSLFRQGVHMTPLVRVDLESLGQVDGVSEGALKSTFHYRCKVAGAREMDIAIMRRVHARIQELEAS